MLSDVYVQVVLQKNAAPVISCCRVCSTRNAESQYLGALPRVVRALTVDAAVGQMDPRSLCLPLGYTLIVLSDASTLFLENNSKAWQIALVLP